MISAFKSERYAGSANNGDTKGDEGKPWGTWVSQPMIP
jgi:hypothetical protein